MSYSYLQVNTGVSGQIVDTDTKEGISGAIIAVEGIDHNVTADTNGYFWRLVVEGKYKLMVYADMYV